jgi:hypothetical protein
MARSRAPKIHGTPYRGSSASGKTAGSNEILSSHAVLCPWRARVHCKTKGSAFSTSSDAFVERIVALQGHTATIAEPRKRASEDPASRPTAQPSGTARTSFQSLATGSTPSFALLTSPDLGYEWRLIVPRIPPVLVKLRGRAFMCEVSGVTLSFSVYSVNPTSRIDAVERSPNLCENCRLKDFATSGKVVRRSDDACSRSAKFRLLLARGTPMVHPDVAMSGSERLNRDEGNAFLEVAAKVRRDSYYAHTWASTKLSRGWNSKQFHEPPLLRP